MSKEPAPGDAHPFAVHGRLRVHANRRFLEYEDGTPFFYMADTAWELFHRLSIEEARLYLVDRAAKGFSAIQAVALAELDGTTVPNANGDLPLESQDPALPVEAYFAHMDQIVREANRVGLVVAMLPAWGRYWKRDSNKQANPGILTERNARAYGLFLGKRYASSSLIWVLGGDRNVENPEELAIIEAMAGGLREGDGGAHLMTFHPCGPGQSSTALHACSWLDFNMCQSSHGARNHDNGLFIERDLGLSPLKPTLDGEPRYERLPVGFYNADANRLDRFDDFDVRQAAWWAVLAGACGHTYGNNNIWQMYDSGRPSIVWADVPWHQAIDHPGAHQMGILRRYVASRPFMSLRPSGTALVDAPREGGAKVRAAVADDGSWGVVYSPMGARFTVDLEVFRPGPLRASWFDPRYGTLHEFFRANIRSFQTFEPPTHGRGCDWVLELSVM